MMFYSMKFKVPGILVVFVSFPFKELFQNAACSQTRVFLPYSSRLTQFDSFKLVTLSTRRVSPTWCSLSSGYIKMRPALEHGFA